jgi:hypothetical protein
LFYKARQRRFYYLQQFYITAETGFRVPFWLLEYSYVS